MSVKGFLAFLAVFIGGLGAGYVFFGASASGGTIAPAPDAERTTLASNAVLDEAGVRRIVEAYIVENPVVIMRSIDDWQRNGFTRDLEVRAEPFLAVLEDTNDVPLVGAVEPEVAIIEFFDYQCPHCKANYPVLERILAEDPTVALMPKYLPILGDGSENDMSLYAARAAEAARLQGKFADFHEGIMAREAPLTRQAVQSVAEAVGLDMTAFNAAIASQAVIETVDQSRALATDIGIINAGTPGYIIGGKIMIGAAPDSYERIKEMIEAARQQKS